MKYEVSIEIKHDFPVDCKGLCKYAETLGLQMTMQTDKWISFSKEGELTPTESDFKSEEHKLLKEYHDALTEEEREPFLSTINTIAEALMNVKKDEGENSDPLSRNGPSPDTD